MPTDAPRVGRRMEERQVALETEIESVNMRIARLAMALGVDLTTEAAVERVIDRSAMPRRLVSPHGQDAEVDGQVNHHDGFALADRRTDQDHRTAYEWEELRGLLVLRYEMEKHYAQHMGFDATRNILTTAEADQTRRGFPPHADGLDMRPLLGD